MYLYHGSNVEVRQPRIPERLRALDFGAGFYTTSSREQAIKWSKVVAKRRQSGFPCICTFFLDEAALGGLRVLKFDSPSGEWLDFVVACRHGDTHAHDIVEGPMANDTIYNYVQDFIDGKISRAAFWELAKFKHPTHQICFCTERALETLEFSGSEEVFDG